MKRLLVPLAVAALTLLPHLAPPRAQTNAATGPLPASPGPYAVEFVATAATGVDMNVEGTVIGTAYRDIGCGSTCLPPLETVVWYRGRRVVLPVPPGQTSVTLTDINDQGWIVGHGGSRAVVWRPTGPSAGAFRPYQALDLGVLPGKTLSSAAGVDELGRVVGWSTTSTFPPNGAPFMWTEAGGMVDLTTLGFPNEWPLGISPGGTVATFGYWYRLDDSASVTAMPPPPPGFYLENSRVAINDAGDQARFLVVPIPQILDYLFRLHHEGAWQQLSTVPTGHLTTYGVGSINGARDVTAMVASTGVLAYGPTGLAQALGPLVSAAYGGGAVTSGGPMNAKGEILARMIIGQSQRLVRLVPGQPCAAGCIRVTEIDMEAHGPGYCNQGQNEVTATLTVTDEAGLPLPGVALTAHLLDDYWMDKTLAGQTDAAGQVTFTHVGPPCVGAIALIVTEASAPGRTLDRMVGTLARAVIPTPGVVAGAAGAPEASSASGPASVLEGASPNPFHGATAIRFTLPEAAHVRLVAYDALGREVARLADAAMAQGSHVARFEADGLPGGVYFARLTVGDAPARTLRLTLLK